MLIYCKVWFWDHSHIESIQSLHQIDASVWVGVALWKIQIKVLDKKFRFF